MRFIVASYGTKHVGMLLTHLHSIARSHPEARAAVYWQDIPAPQIDAIRAVFPSFDFPRTEFEFRGDWIKLISNKVRAWNRAAAEYASEPALCLLDVDTLVLRDLSPFFAKNDADVIFTWKPERTPLNTGVMLARGGEPTCAFFREWEKRTVEILESPELYAQANDFSLGYGGTDQMSFFQMIGYEPGRTAYEIEVAGHRVRLRGEPCALLNETNSRPITDHTHVIHYKGSPCEPRQSHASLRHGRQNQVASRDRTAPRWMDCRLHDGRSRGTLDPAAAATRSARGSCGWIAFAGTHPRSQREFAAEAA